MSKMKNKAALASHTTRTGFNQGKRRRRDRITTLSAASQMALEPIEPRILMSFSTISYATAGSTYNQSFDSLGGTAVVAAANETNAPIDLGNASNTAPVPGNANLDGWILSAATAYKYGVTTSQATSITGGSFVTYGDSTTAGANRALGMIATSPTGTEVIAAEFVNSTGSTLNAATVTYGRGVARDASEAKSLNFGYAVTATGQTAVPTSLTSVSNLNYSPTPFGTAQELDGSVSPNLQQFTNVTFPISGGWANGHALWLTWTISSAASGGPGLAIDNFSMSALANFPPTVSSVSVSPSSVSPNSTLSLQAQASETSGTISSVNFYRESTPGTENPAGDTLVPGTATNNSGTWTLNNVSTAGQAAGTYTYYAVATDSTGNSTSVSPTATLTITALPAITTQPAAQTVGAGAFATFTAAASGVPAPTVQWYSSPDNGAGNDWASISGATSTTLQVLASSNIYYQAVFTNTIGSTPTNSVELTVSGAVFTAWNFNSLTIASNETPATSTGSGSAESIGMTATSGTGALPTPNATGPDASAIIAGTGSNGGSSDGSTGNIWRVVGNNGWNSNAAIATQGAQFLTSTVGYGALNLRFDLYATTQGEGNFEVQYTTDGSTWSNVPAADLSVGPDTGISVQNNTSSSNTVTGGYFNITGGQNWYNQLSANLTSLSGVNGNANFGVRIVNASTAGDCVNASGGAVTNTSGNWRFDEVQIAGTTQATPTVTVSDSGGAYTGSTFPATAQVNGSASLEGVIPTLAYYAGTAATGTPLSGAPSTLGTYTVQASFAGSIDYSAASTTATFSITPRPLTVTANPQSVTQGYTSLPPLTYTLTTGSLVGTDALSGSLSCTAGSAVGTYAITQGSLTAGSNYAITFYPSVLYVTSAAALVTAAQSAGVSSTSPATVQIASTSPGATMPEVVATGSGFDGTLTVAQYQGDPATGLSFTGSYFDVNVASSDVSASSSVQVTFNGLLPNVPLFWLNSGAADPVLDGSGNPIRTDGTGSATVTFTTTTSPTIAQLTGTDFIIGTEVPTVTVSDAGGAYSGSTFQATALVNGSASLEGVTPTITYINGDINNSLVNVEVLASTSASGPFTSTLGSVAPGTTVYYDVVAQSAGSSVSNDNSNFSPNGTSDSFNSLPQFTLNASGATFSAASLGAQFTGTGNSAGTASGSTLSGVRVVAGVGVRVNDDSQVVLLSGSLVTTAGFSAITAATNPYPPTNSGVVYVAGHFVSATEAADGSGTEQSTEPLISYAPATTNAGSPAPSPIGTYSAEANFAGSTDYAAASSAPAVFSITQPNSTVTVTSGNEVYTAGGYLPTTTVTGAAGTDSNATITYVYYAGTNTAGANLGSVAPINVGTYTLVASFAGDGQYNAANSAPVTFQITPITLVPSFTASSKTYDSTNIASGTYSLVGVLPGDTVSLNASATFGQTTVGNNLTVTAVNLSLTGPAAGNYSLGTTTSLTSTASIMRKVVSSVTITANSKVYNGTNAATVASYTVPGVLPGDTVTASSTSVTFGQTTVGNNITVTASGITLSGASAGNYSLTSPTATTTANITAATATVTVSDASGPYTGSPFTATETVTGVNGTAAASLEGVTPSVTYYSGTAATGTTLAGAPSTAGTYTVKASFAGSTDYLAASSGTATFTISAFNSTVTVSDAGGTYSGATFPATAQVDGSASLEGVTPTLAYYAGTSATGTPLSGAPSTAGTYTVKASFAGSSDYAASTGTATFTISKAGTPTVTVSDAGGVYTGSTYPATATVNGSASLEGVTPTITYINGDINHSLLNIEIMASTSAGGPFTSTLGTVTPGTTIYYEVVGQSAGSSVTNINAQYSPDGETDGFNSLPSFTLNASGATFSAASLGAAFTGVSASAGTASGSTLAGVRVIAGNGVRMNDDSQAVLLSGSLVAGAGFSAITASTNPYPPTNSGIMYVANHPVSISELSDGAGSDQSAQPLLSYDPATTIGRSMTAPSAIGTYSAEASFAGSTDYPAAASSSPAVFSITTPNTATVTVSDAGGVYTGSTFPATAAVNGSASLEGVTPTITYINGDINNALVNVEVLASTSASGPFTSTLGTVAPGTTVYYEVVAQSAGGSVSNENSNFSPNGTSDAFNSLPAFTLNAGGATFSAATLGAAYTGVGASAGSGSGATLANVRVVAGNGVRVNDDSQVVVLSGSLTTGSGFSAITASSNPYPPTNSGVLYVAGHFVSATEAADGSGTEQSTEPLISYLPATTGAGSPAPSAIGTYSAVANFAGSSDYPASASTPAVFSITQPNSTVTVSSGNEVYNATGYLPTTTVTGAAGTDSNATITYVYYAGTNTSGANLGSVAPINVGTYTLVASFAGDGQYNAANSAPDTFQITPVTLSASFTASGKTYDTTNIASGTYSLVGVLPGDTVNLNGSATFGQTNAGHNLTVTATNLSLTGPSAGNYTLGTTTLTSTASITPKVISAVTITANGRVYNGTNTATIVAYTVPGVLSGDTVTASGTSATFAQSTVGNGITVTASGITLGGASAGNYSLTNATATTTASITAATPTVTVADASGAYTGSAFAATETVTGVSGTAAASLEGVTPTLTYYAGTAATGTPLSGAPSTVGTYTVKASFAGSTDYSAASSNAATFTIGRATATVAVSDAGGLPTGSSYPATATVDGSASLEGITPTLTYYSGRTATGTPLSGDPSTIGNYTVVASFAGSTDYTSGGASTTFTISSLPSWLSPLSAATWNPATSTLTVFGATMITSDPGSAEPIIVASGSAAQVTIAPYAGDVDIHIGGVMLTNSAGITMQSVGSGRSHSNHNVLVVGTLGAAADPTVSIDSSSTFDLQDNDLVIHTGTADTGGKAELANVQALAALGRKIAPGGDLFSKRVDAWSGNGLTSSVAAAQDAYTGPNAGFELNVLGVVDNSDFTSGFAYKKWIVGSATETLGTNDIIVKYTYNGDFNLEGEVGTDAATVFSADYAPGIKQKDFAFGDTNGDGFVDANDATAFSGLLYGLGTGGAEGPQL